MIINLPTKRISVISVTFQRVLPTRWRRKLVGIYMERNYVTVALCVLLLSFNGRFLRKHKSVSSEKNSDTWNWFLQFGYLRARPE